MMNEGIIEIKFLQIIYVCTTWSEYACYENLRDNFQNYVSLKDYGCSRNIVWQIIDTGDKNVTLKYSYKEYFIVPKTVLLNYLMVVIWSILKLI